MEERYIASIDLGTSRLAVCVARIQGQNTQVVYYKESPSLGVNQSYVLNPGKLKARLKEAVTDAQQSLHINIHKVIVGLPRWYVRQETAEAKAERIDKDSLISADEIRTLKNDALASYPVEDEKKDVLYGAVAQSFSTEDSLNEPENDIIGQVADTLEGNFKVFIGSRKFSSNIDIALQGIGIGVAKKYFTPGITARAVLKPEQMENGVALIDLGAGVSSVTIFKDKILRYYSAVPFGGKSITNDIKSECNFTFELAENIKKAYGACMPGKLQSFGEKNILIEDEDGKEVVQVSVKRISEIVTARMKEIIEALLYRIEESGYNSEDKLRAGIVVTGGGARMVNCPQFIKELSGYSVTRGLPRRFFTCEGFEGACDCSAATTMGMILSARDDKSINCINGAAVSTGSSTTSAPRKRPTAPQVPERLATETPTTPKETAPKATEAPKDTVQTPPTKPEEQGGTSGPTTQEGKTGSEHRQNTETVEGPVNGPEGGGHDEGETPPEPPTKKDEEKEKQPKDDKKGKQPRFTWRINKLMTDWYNGMKDEEV